MRQSEIGIGLVQIGARNGDVFLAAAFDGLVVTLLRRFDRSPRARFSAVAARSRSCAETSSLAKSFCARSLSSFFSSRSACGIDHGLLRRLHFLLAGSGQREREIRFAHAHRGLVDADSLLVIRVVEPRQQRALLHLLALFDGQLDDAPRHLEADQALVRFDVAGERELIRGAGFRARRG